MRRLGIAVLGWSAVVAGVTNLACSGSRVGPGPLSPAATAAIVDSVSRLLTSWQVAVSSLDTVAMGSFFADDSAFRWIEDGRVRYGHPADLVAAWRATVPNVRAMQLILDGTEIHPLAAGVAVVSTLFTQKVTDTMARQGGFIGATSMVVVSTPEGWRFLVGHTSSVSGNSPQPLAPPEVQGGVLRPSGRN